MLTQDFNSWVPFIGIVEDIDDPRKLGRVKLRCIGIHPDDLPSDQLDWATPIQPTTSAGIQQVGSSPTGILRGSRVIGFYLDGESRTMPMILGTFAAIPGNDDQRHDVSELARGINSITKDTIKNEPKSPYAAKYPYNKVIQTTSGHVIELDDTPGAERIHLMHKSGSYVEINNEGRVVIKAVKDQINVVAGDLLQYSKGDTTMEADGKLVINIKGAAVINSDGPCNVISKKRISLSAPVVSLQT